MKKREKIKKKMNKPTIFFSFIFLSIVLGIVLGLSLLQVPSINAAIKEIMAFPKIK